MIITDLTLTKIAQDATRFHGALDLASAAFYEACITPTAAEQWYWFYLFVWAEQRYAAWECEQHMRREYAAELPIVEALLERSSPWSEANSSR